MHNLLQLDDKVSDWIIFLSLCLVQGCLVQIPSLQDMWHISAFALVVQITGVFVCSLLSIWFGEPNPVPRDKWEFQLDFHGFFQFIGVTIYLLEGTGPVIPIINSMEEPEKGGMLVMSSGVLYSILVMVYGTVAYGWGLGGLEIGDECTLIIDCITLYSLKRVVQVSIVLALTLTVPITAYPGIEMLEVMLLENKDENEETSQTISNHLPDATSSGRKNWKMRLFVTIAAVVVGSYIQELIVLLSLVGSIFMNYISLIVPPMLYYIALEKTGTPAGFLNRAMMCFTFSVGVSLAIVGCGNAIFSLIREL